MRIVNVFLECKEYLQDYLVRMAHHSTAIEGNTLTQEQTTSILVENKTFREISEREFFEVKNYKQTISFILEQVRNQTPLCVEIIKSIHSLCMQKLLENAGVFKKIENLIVGAKFETTKPYLVPTRLYEFCQNLNFALTQTKNKNEKLKMILKAHFDFEKIHPFSDGNGRVGRLLIFYSCLQEDIIPPIFQKNAYISFLRNWDLEGLFELSKELQREEEKRVKKFMQNQGDNNENPIFPL